ncbi:MAG TPA: DUF268 domain-containing protein [Anaerolineales bacterium]
MGRRLQRAHAVLAGMGIDVLSAMRSLRGLPRYFANLRALEEQKKAAGSEWPMGMAYPCLTDWSAGAGMASGHYFHQDLLVARRIRENQPREHVDVGSRIDGFVAHVAAFRPITVVDIRPMSGSIPNIMFVQADMLGTLPSNLESCCDSLSCLHVIEHFGLGRYGDPVTYDGHLLGLKNLERMLKSGGKLYLSVPIGPQRIEFNAHRVFSAAYVLELLEHAYRLDQFSFVDDSGDLHENVRMTESDARQSFGCTYGCGIYEMTKV